MNAEELTEELEDLLSSIDDGDPLADLVKRTRSFADRSMLTTNSGFIVTLHDGSEFQITVVQSKQGS